MKNASFFLGLILTAAAASGCAQLLSPYGPAFRSYPFARRPVVSVDPYTAARGRWDQVMRLPAGSVIDVLFMDGAAHVGTIAGVDRSSVRVLVNNIEEQIPRAEVLRVDLVDLPGSEVGAVAKHAVTGAALGLGAAALIAGVIGGEAWPPPGALLRGGAAIGGVAGGEAALTRRQGRVIYLAENQLPVPLSSRPGAVDSGGKEAAHITESYSVGAWSTIASLAAGEVVQVVRTNGWRHRGRLASVDDSSLRLDIDGAELRIARASIVRVEVLQIPEAVTAKRRVSRRLPRVFGTLAGATDGAYGLNDLAAANGSAQLVRIGMPILPFGGAQPQILQFQRAPLHLIPLLVDGPPPGVAGLAPAPRAVRAAICHGQAVPLRR